MPYANFIASVEAKKLLTERDLTNLDKMIENQASGVTEASAAVEEMIGNINAINKSIEKIEDVSLNAR